MMKTLPHKNTKPVKLRLSHRMMVRLSNDQRTTLRTVARRNGISDSTQARLWIVERLQNEVKKK